jgi:hypothetical protein
MIASPLDFPLCDPVSAALMNFGNDHGRRSMDA